MAAGVKAARAALTGGRSAPFASAQLGPMDPAPAASYRRRLLHLSPASPAAVVKSLFPAELSPVSDLRLTMEQLGHGSVRAPRASPPTEALLYPPRPLTGASRASPFPLGPKTKPGGFKQRGRESLPSAAPGLWGSSYLQLRPGGAPPQPTDGKELFFPAPPSSNALRTPYTRPLNSFPNDALKAHFSPFPPN